MGKPVLRSKIQNLKWSMKSLCPRLCHCPCPGPTKRTLVDHTIPPPFRNVFNVVIGLFGTPPGQLHAVLSQVALGHFRVTSHVPSNLLSSALTLPISSVSRTASVMPGICVSSLIFIPWSPFMISEDCLSCHRARYPDRVSGTLSAPGHHRLSAGPLTVPGACAHACPKP